jgi:hypothetical protein
VTVDVAKLLALAKAHPDRVCQLLTVVAAGVVETPQIIVDAVAVAEGGNPLAFAKQHPKFVAELVGECSKNILIDPPLFVGLISAVSPLPWPLS